MPVDSLLKAGIGTLPQTLIGQPARRNVPDVIEVMRRHLKGTVMVHSFTRVGFLGLLIAGGFAAGPRLANASPDIDKIVAEVRDGNKARDTERAQQHASDDALIEAKAQQKAAIIATTQPSNDRVRALETELARVKADLAEARAQVAGLAAERDALRRQLRGQ